MATVRQAVRILLIDPADRVLLLAFRRPEGEGDDEQFWITVGGGIDPGENLEEAIRREVFEEVGLADFDLGPVVWTRREVFRWIDEDIDQSETIFLAQVEAFEPHADSHTDIELEWVREMRWWTLDELDASTETFYPTQLRRYYRQLIEQGPPPEPIDVGP